MKSKLFIGILGGIPLIFSGCISNSSPTEPPMISALDSADKSETDFQQLPPAENDPSNIKKTPQKSLPGLPKTEIGKKCTSHPTPMQEEIISTSGNNPPPTTELTHPAKHRRSPNNYRRGPGAWRAFTRLPQAEQQKLLELQRTAPEEFRKILRNKADELYQQEAARRQELDLLTEKIRQTNNQGEAEKLKKVLRAKLKEDFQLRLNDTRRDIEAYKLRTASLEAELQKREKNCDAIVEVILNKRLIDKTSVTSDKRPEKK